jgi:hypothetical protein
MGVISSLQDWYAGLSLEDRQIIQVMVTGLLVFIIMKPLGVRLVQGFMNRRSLRRRAKLEAAAGKVDDVPRSDPGTQLEFVEVDSTSKVNAGGTVVPTVMSWARRLFRLDISVAGGYIVVGIVLAFVARTEDDAFTFATALWMFSIIWIGLFSYTYFIAHHTSWKLRLLLIGLAALTAMAALATQHFILGFVVGALAAAHWLVSRRIRKELVGLDVPNMKLLVLRVFGSDKNTSFTFGRLEAFWQYLGPYFTVVDPTYIRYRFRWTSPTTLKLVGLGSLFFGGVLIGFISGENEATGLSGWVTANPIPGTLALAGIALPLVVATIFVSLVRTFARNREAVQKKITKTIKKERTKDLTTPDLAMFCYDDTWKVAVDEFTRVADAVLMDLRGYSAARKGCEYEVGFLIDKLPIDRVVFLADTESDRDSIRDLLGRKWSAMHDASPNRRVTEPRATIYTASKHDNHDIQAIVTLLLGAGLQKPVSIAPSQRLVPA